MWRRSVLAVTGRDAASFLDPLQTRCFRGVGDTMLPTLFLNRLGEIVAEAFLWRPCCTATEVFIDVDERRADALRHHLERRRLRADVDIADVSTSFEIRTGQWVQANEPALNSGDIASCPSAGVFPCLQVDPRVPASLNLFRELRCTRRGIPATPEKKLTRRLTTAAFTAAFNIRWARHLVELSDLVLTAPSLERALPFDLNWDSFGYIDSSRCYLGQEVITRLMASPQLISRRLACVALGDQSPGFRIVLNPCPGSCTPRHDATKVVTHAGDVVGDVIGVASVGPDPPEGLPAACVVSFRKLRKAAGLAEAPPVAPCKLEQLLQNLAANGKIFFA